MTPEDARNAIVEAFLDVAPDSDPTTISADARYRDALGIDSMDFLAILEEVAAQTGVEVPEADYTRIETLADFTSYLSSRA